MDIKSGTFPGSFWFWGLKAIWALTYIITTATSCIIGQKINYWYNFLITFYIPCCSTRMHINCTQLCIKHSPVPYALGRGHAMLSQQFLDVHKAREVLATINDESVELWELLLHLHTILHETKSLVHQEAWKAEVVSKWPKTSEQSVFNESHAPWILKTPPNLFSLYNYK